MKKNEAAVSAFIFCPRFRSCLKMSQSSAADLVGNMFFNMLETRCFTFKEAKVCTDRAWWGKCNRWERKQKAVWREARPY